VDCEGGRRRRGAGGGAAVRAEREVIARGVVLDDEHVVEVDAAAATVVDNWVCSQGPSASAASNGICVGGAGLVVGWGARPPRALASPAAVVAVSKLSDASFSLDGSLTFVSCLSGAFVPVRLNQSTIDEYKKGGALVFYYIWAPLKLLLTQEQNRKSLSSLMRGAFAIGDER